MLKYENSTNFLAGTVQNGLIYLYELNSTDGLNNRTLDEILRSSLTQSGAPSCVIA